MRIVSFADGFTSASAPDIVGGASYEEYSLANNSSGNITGLIFDSTEFTSAFGSFELERKGSATYRQTGSIMFSFNGTWAVTFGNYMGDSIIQDTITNPQEVTITINSSTGQVQFSTGNLSGHTGTKLKIDIVRIKT